MLIQSFLKKQDGLIPKTTFSTLHAAPEISRKRENYNDSEDDCDSPVSECYFQIIFSNNWVQNLNKASYIFLIVD